MKSDKKVENCWEFWNCPKRVKEDCLAYQLGLGKKCFLISGDYKPQANRCFANCFHCDWFQRLNFK